MEIPKSTRELLLKCGHTVEAGKTYIRQKTVIEGEGINWTCCHDCHRRGVTPRSYLKAKWATEERKLAYRAERLRKARRMGDPLLPGLVTHGLGRMQ